MERQKIMWGGGRRHKRENRINRRYIPIYVFVYPWQRQRRTRRRRNKNGYRKMKNKIRKRKICTTFYAANDTTQSMSEKIETIKWCEYTFVEYPSDTDTGGTGNTHSLNRTHRKTDTAKPENCYILFHNRFSNARCEYTSISSQI